MAEKEQIFSSKMKSDGIFLFRDFYKFCYDWLVEETELNVSEDKYVEKLQGDEKEIDVVWTGWRKITDYFKFVIKVKFQVRRLKEVEIMEDNVKIKKNSGYVEIKITGTLVRDYDGKFESNAFRKFLRGTYEKWIIPSRIEQFEEKLISDADEFLSQAKAYLDLEGKR